MLKCTLPATLTSAYRRISSVLGPLARVFDTVKGKEWYQADDVAAAYEDKRFSRGGRLIDTREREAVLSALAPVEGQDILEIACGTGRFTVMLGERGADVIGMDISKPMMLQGVSKANRAGVDGRVGFIRGDAARLPFPDDSFDAVFAMRFFHLAPSPEGFLSEMRRVSRETIFFDTFNSFSTRTVYNWLLPMGSRLYDDETVETMLDEAHLELVHAEHDFVVPYGCYRSIPDRIARPIRSVDERLGETAVGDRLASVSFWHAKPR